MKKLSRLTVAVVIAAAMILLAVFTASAADQLASTGASTGIVIHVKSPETTPYIYFWNTLPEDKTGTYPGARMTPDSSMQTSGWYVYTLTRVSKANFIITDGSDGLDGQLSDELSCNAGEYWYSGGRLRSRDPEEPDDYESVDLREDSIYFVITTRFYDGDSSNNVHCWDDSKAGNPDSDPAWRGDFKGLAEKLDYIKALGFSAIWITPVVENASGYDYHGYHAFDFTKVDERYESDDFTYEDLILAAHDKGMKIIQDVVFNHTGNFGEANLEPIFTKEYSDVTELGDMESTMIPTKKLLDYCGVKDAAGYYALPSGVQYDKRLQLIKQTQGFSGNVSRDSLCNSKNYYHNGYYSSLNWDDYSAKYCQIAGDCVDLNTENPEVAKYTVDAYSNYIDMGVDGFRVDTVRHIPRLSLNLMYNSQLLSAARSAGNENFSMFGEICCRYNEVWYRNHASESVAFYTWAESDDSWAQKWKKTNNPDNVKSNIALTLEHWDAYDSTANQPTSDNAFLNGLSYHTPDYSRSSGMGAIDFQMHWQFDEANSAFEIAKAEDRYFNDSTWNVVYVESHDYAPDRNQKVRFTGGEQTWAENLDLMFTFRGIPCLYYGGEIQFQKGCIIDEGPNRPLSTTGRAYYGDHLEGNVTASDFCNYSASGEVEKTLAKPLAKHIQKLNAIRRAIPALQKGQYTVSPNYVDGSMAYIRRYTDAEVDSLALVAVSGGATFKNIPNGRYIDAVTGHTVEVTNGTLRVSATGKGNMRVYVCCAEGFTGISGAIGPSGQTYLK